MFGPLSQWTSPSPKTQRVRRVSTHLGKRVDIGLPGGRNYLKCLQIVLAFILIMALSSPVYPNEAKAAVDRGIREESHRQQYDAASASTSRTSSSRCAESVLRYSCFDQPLLLFCAPSRLL
jgi:hypothetical protein